MQRRRWRERVEEGDGGVVRKDERGGWREGTGVDAWTRTAGSTAVVGKEEVVVANCGDSRAVLCCGDVAVPLSVDHKLAEKESGSSWRKGHRLEWIPCPRRACYIEVNGYMGLYRSNGANDGLYSMLLCMECWFPIALVTSASAERLSFKVIRDG